MAKVSRNGRVRYGSVAMGGLFKYQQAQAAQPASAPFASLNAIGTLQPPDGNGVMLPSGFRSRVVARSGEPPITSPGYTWHPAPDGGCLLCSQ
jgi:hypothetical protein